MADTTMRKHARSAHASFKSYVQLLGKSGSESDAHHKAVLPSARAELVRRGYFELADDGCALLITAKGRAMLRRLELEGKE